MLDEIPANRPQTPLLDQIADPADLRQLEVAQLAELAEELRLFLAYCVGTTGGHRGAGPGEPNAGAYPPSTDSGRPANAYGPSLTPGRFRR